MASWDSLKCALLCLAAVGCGKPDGGSAPPSSTSQVALTVFAASSLTESFADLAAAFEAAHPEVRVRTNFAGSQVLRTQLLQGAAADVFASASEPHMAALMEAGVVAESEVFADNTLVLIVPRGVPPGASPPIASFAELPRAARIVVGTPEVPVGAYTRMLLTRADAALGDDFAAGVRAHIVSEEPNVRLVRAKVELGEADAAIVYRTDAVDSDRIVALPIPASLVPPAHYPIAALARAQQPVWAARFIAHVRSPEGQRILAAHGFLPLLPGAP